MKGAANVLAELVQSYPQFAFLKEKNAELDTLNLSVRSAHCLSSMPNVVALLATRETDLMRLRNFGRVSLADVRKKLALWLSLCTMGTPPPHVLLAVYNPGPELDELWNAPARPVPLAETMAQLLNVLSRVDPKDPLRVDVSALRPRPEPPFSYESATLDQVVRHVLRPLRDRELEIATRRFGALGTSGCTLAEVGQAYRLTRERVRQIIHAALHKLTKADAAAARRPLMDVIAATIDGAGGLATEAAIAEALRRRFGGPDIELGPMLRILEQVEPAFHSPARGLWSRVETTAETLDRISAAAQKCLRSTAKPLLEEDVTAYVVHACGGSVSDGLVRAALRSDTHLRRDNEGRYSLREWASLVPQSLDDYIYLAIKGAGRPKHYLWITDRVNSLLPDGRDVGPRSVQAVLAGKPDRFARTREGTYGLAEWGTTSRRQLTELVSDVLRMANSPLTEDEISARVRAIRQDESEEAVRNVLQTARRFDRDGDGRYTLSAWRYRAAAQ